MICPTQSHRRLAYFVRSIWVGVSEWAVSAPLCIKFGNIYNILWNKSHKPLKNSGSSPKIQSGTSKPSSSRSASKQSMQPALCIWVNAWSPCKISSTPSWASWGRSTWETCTKYQVLTWLCWTCRMRISSFIRNWQLPTLSCRRRKSKFPPSKTSTPLSGTTSPIFRTSSQARIAIVPANPKTHLRIWTCRMLKNMSHLILHLPHLLNKFTNLKMNYDRSIFYSILPSSYNNNKPQTKLPANANAGK